MTNLNTRPIVCLGAAFLLTVSAALFVPRLLPLVALPLATATVVTRLRSHHVIAAVVGCLVAWLCCWLYWLRGDVNTAVELYLLRDWLCARAQELNPAPTTGITLGILFGDKSGIPPQVRVDLQRSGMAHLTAVSGLHISIAAAGAAVLARRLGLRRGLQFMVMAATTLVFWFASGMSVSATRAVIMVLLGLGAELLGRRADGLTSLSLAAVLLVGLHPPLVADLSFQLSFLAVLGILLLAPLLTRRLEGLWQAALGDRRATPHFLIGAVATSLAAQLAVTPVIGWTFGAVPLLGVLTNLVAIPLVYPVMLLGLLSSVAMLLGQSGIASLLLAGANVFSQLVALLARITASLPLCSFKTVFPVDLAAVGLVVLTVVLATCLPTSVQLRWSLTGGIAVLGCLMIVASVTTAAGTISVATSTRTGSLVIASPNGTVVIDNAPDNYWRQRDRDLLARLGHGDTPDCLLVTYPSPERQQLDGSVQFYGVASHRVYTTDMLADPTQLVEGITVRSVVPYCTEIIIGTTKLMKYDAEYGTIIRYGGNVPDDAAILVDWAGNMLDSGGNVTILRRPDGSSYLRVPM